ncbi:hypothetical protein PXW82_29900, partial [Klebsiella pneumoniae]|nr:hypothetical protein [Klebsiella pneumoniae]
MSGFATLDLSVCIVMLVRRGEAFCKRPVFLLFRAPSACFFSGRICGFCHPGIEVFFVNIDEVAKWRPFTDPDGNIWDLSFLDAHE